MSSLTFINSKQFVKMAYDVCNISSLSQNERLKLHFIKKPLMIRDIIFTSINLISDICSIIQQYTYGTYDHKFELLCLCIFSGYYEQESRLYINGDIMIDNEKNLENRSNESLNIDMCIYYSELIGDIKLKLDLPKQNTQYYGLILNYDDKYEKLYVNPFLIHFINYYYAKNYIKYKGIYDYKYEIKKIDDNEYTYIIMDKAKRYISTVFDNGKNYKMIKSITIKIINIDQFKFFALILKLIINNLLKIKN